MKGDELAREVSDSLNSGFNPSEFVSEISRDHRYLQGEVFTQVLKPMIIEFARKAEAGEYDQRNERACKECREMADAMDWTY